MKLSVIVPVYNTAPYLPKCLDSILAQDVEGGMEIIVVDDGSTDNSPAICDDYAATNSCIKVIHLSNMGASAARNKGLEIATGEFITFVDSDDYLGRSIYREALEYVTPNIDCVIFGYNTVDGNGGIISGKSYFLETLVIDKILKSIVFPLETAVWNKLFSRQSIDKVQFPENCTHNEDLVFICQMISQSSQWLTVPIDGYNYVKRCDSITMAKGFRESVFDEVKCKDLAADLLLSKFKNQRVECSKLRFIARLGVLRKLASLRILGKYKDMRKDYLAFMAGVFKDTKKKFNLRITIEYLLQKRFWWCYQVLIRTWNR